MKEESEPQRPLTIRYKLKKKKKSAERDDIPFIGENFCDVNAKPSLPLSQLNLII